MAREVALKARAFRYALHDARNVLARDVAILKRTAVKRERAKERPFGDTGSRDQFT